MILTTGKILLATGKGKDYPLLFQAMPYNLNYDIVGKRFKSLQFALLFLSQLSNDDVEGVHKNISSMESVGDVHHLTIGIPISEFPDHIYSVTSDHRTIQTHPMLFTCKADDIRMLCYPTSLEQLHVALHFETAVLVFKNEEHFSTICSLNRNFNG